MITVNNKEVRIPKPIWNSLMSNNKFEKLFNELVEDIIDAGDMVKAKKESTSFTSLRGYMKKRGLKTKDQ